MPSPKEDIFTSDDNRFPLYPNENKKHKKNPSNISKQAYELITNPVYNSRTIIDNTAEPIIKYRRDIFSRVFINQDIITLE